MPFRIRSLAKRAALIVAPNAARRFLRQRDEASAQAVRDRTARIAEVIQATVGGRVVAAGPFRGLKYGAGTSGSQMLPKLAGTYEEELGAVLELVVARAYREIVNIGCGEGYYAVGLALRMPTARVLAFDTDPDAQRACAATAAENGVQDRVTVGATCTVETLTRLARAGTLVVCDCEGCEASLFTTDVVRQLESVDFIIELHDFVDRTISGQLTNRFAATHAVTIVATQPRVPSRYPVLAGLSPADQTFAVDEGRPGPMSWLVGVARTAS